MEPKATTPEAKQPDTLDSLAERLKTEPWKVAAIKAKHGVQGNREMDEGKFASLVKDVEGITIGAAPEEEPEKK